MLWTLLASALLLAGRATAQSTVECVTPGSVTPKVQDGENNYVIDSFSGSLFFSYAINQCTGTDLVATMYYKYTCSKDDDGVWWVTKKSYDDASCSGTGKTIDTWSDEETEAGEKGYFKCDGKNNYAAIQIGLDPECGSTTTLIGGLGGCASNPTVLDTNFYCDSTSALVQLFANPGAHNLTFDSCSTPVYCNKWEFTSTCKKVATLFEQEVYGTYAKCATSESTNDGDDGDDESSASSPITALAIVVALIVGLFH